MKKFLLIWSIVFLMKSAATSNVPPKLAHELETLKRSVSDIIKEHQQMKNTVEALEEKFSELQDESVEKDHKIAKLEELSKVFAPSSCTEYFNFGISESDYYYLHHDGPIFNAPVQKFCNMTMEAELSDHKNTLIIATGAPFTTSVATEMINIGKQIKCYSLPDFPDDVALAASDVVGSKIVVCGGRNPAEPLSACYTLGQKKMRWRRAGNLHKARFGTASIAVGEKLFITGGKDKSDPFHPNYGFLDSTEFYNVASMTALPGPKLPVKVAFHCIVQFNSSHLMVIGGRSGTIHLKSTYLYSITEGSFVNGPDLMDNRQNHECGVLTANSTSYIVIAGGHKDDLHDLDSVEYLDVSNTNAGWKLGPKLPKPIVSGSMVTYNDEVILIGGSDNHNNPSSSIYTLSCIDTGCEWNEMATKLSHERSFHTTFLVPDNFVSCP